ncbi:MAG TPA: hypothetical protein PLV59_00310 [Candidatus Dojkabacteria bacterium]|nr:hypothetical protein [Candidatus Dojkabacteria bacterium]
MVQIIGKEREGQEDIILEENATYKITQGTVVAFEYDFDGITEIAKNKTELGEGAVFEVVNSDYSEEYELMDGSGKSVNGILVSIEFDMYILLDGDYTLEQIPGGDLF